MALKSYEIDYNSCNRLDSHGHGTVTKATKVYQGRYIYIYTRYDYYKRLYLYHIIYIYVCVCHLSDAVSASCYHSGLP